MSNQKGFSPIVIILALVILSGLVIAGSLYMKYNPQNDLLTKNLSLNKNTPLPTVSGLRTKTSRLDDSLNLMNYRSVINDGEIFLAKSGKLYILNTNSMEMSNFQIENLQNFTDLSFSSDGQYLFANADSYIIIYHLPSKKLLKIEADTEKIGPNPRVEGGHISPNNKYFIVTTSCCPGDVGRGVFDFTGKLIKQLTGGTAIWSPDGSRFAMSKGEFELSVLSDGSIPRNSSIYLEEAGSIVTEKLLIKASSQSSFIPLEWLDNTTLIYEQSTYKKPFPENPSDEEINNEQSAKQWEEVYQNPTIVYWKLNIDTKTKEQISAYERKIDFGSYSPTREWKIVTEVEDNKFVRYIVKIDNSLKINIDVQDALWKPTLP